MGITTTSLTHLHASLFDSVRRIRAEALDLLETTDQIITTLNDTSLKENDAQMRKQRALMIGNKIISEHGPQVQKYFYSPFLTLLTRDSRICIQVKNSTFFMNSLTRFINPSFSQWHGNTYANIPIVSM